MKRFTFLLFVLLAAIATASAQTTLIAFGATWKYLDNGSNLGTAWRDSSFNDVAWASGAAQLGYGDGDEATIVSFGPSSTNKYTTTYFRKKLLIANVNIYQAFTFNMLRDDGIVIYVNGKEAYRNNMFTGTNANTRFAATNCSDDGNTVQSRSVLLAAGNFISGNNTIAVEVHQCDLTSSDLTFDLELLGNTLLPTTPSSFFTFGTSWKYLDNGTDQGSAWKDAAFSDGSWASGASQLGYGDGDEVTTVGFGPDANNKYITTYFRKTFNITNIALFQSFTFNMYRDDGIVIYVNGVEVHRNTMPAGQVLYNTLASAAASDDGNTMQVVTLTTAASGFVSGNNTIAVEIHQNAGNSSDLTWDLELLGTPFPSGGATITRGPYLQSATSSSIILHWRTSVAVNSRIRYGSSPSNYTDSVTVGTSTTEHIVTLTGLSPFTKYYYSIGSGTGVMQGGPDNYFVTSPLTGAEGKYTFMISGDCGNNSTNQKNVRDRYNTYMGDSITNGWLLVGDNAYNGGLDAEFTSSFFNIYQGSIMKHAPLWPAPGNHDYDNNAANQDSHNVPYYAMFDLPVNGEAGGVPSNNEAFYSWNYGNVHFLSLDSYGEESNTRLYDTLGAQVTWIKQDLAANTLPWVVVYWHHPPYTMGSHNSDTEGELINMRTRFIRILERYGVDVIICGHSHDYERSKLMKGHYGNEASFNASTHNLSQSSGKYDGSANSCTYLKDSLHSLDGTIYIVSGSAGQLGGTQTGYPHNALPFADATHGGSLMLQFNGDRLDAKWLCADGIIRDQFTIIKDGSKIHESTIDLGDTITMTADWNGNYTWPHSGATTRSVNVIPAATTTYYVTDQYQCIADTFKVHVTIPTIDASASTLNAVCAGNSFMLPFVTTGRFWPGNIFTAQLSDAAGNFASPVNIGTLNAIVSDSIPVTIPAGTPDGAGYQIRIIASVPGIFGSGMVSPFVVNAAAPLTSVMDDDSDNSICLGDTITFTAGGAPYYQFFIDTVSQGPLSSVNTLMSSSLTNGQTITVRGSNACGSVTSPGISFAVISAPVAILNVSEMDNTICAGDTISFTASGGDLFEFFVNTISQGAASSVNSFASTALTNGVTVQVNISNVCFMSDTSAVISVDPLPAPPVAADLAACFNSTVPALVATGTNIEWYNDPALTTQVAVGNTFNTGNTATGMYSYYATQTDSNGCVSPAEATNLVINALPSVPSTANETVCFNSAVPSLSATGNNIAWYNNASLSTQVAAGNTFSTGHTAPGTYTYYATQTDANGCEGPSEQADLVIYALPSAPVAANETVCDGSVVPALSAAGNAIVWYSNPALTTQVGTGNSFTTGNTLPGSYSYYATQTDGNGCVSTPSTVVLLINALPAAPVVTNASACFNAAIPPLIATGNTITWYANSALTNPVAVGNSFNTGNTAAGTYTYYSTQTDVNGCESPSAQVNLVVYALPAAPVTSNQLVCANAAVPSLNASGSSITWYSTASLTTQVQTGNTFATGNILPGTYSYYATQTDANGCEGPAAQVDLVIYALPAAPLAQNRTVCDNAIIPSLSATGNSIVWYSNSSLSTQVFAGNTFATGNTLSGIYTYYATQTDANGCQSNPTTVVLTINAVPVMPVVTGSTSYCIGDAMQALVATGQNVLWYANSNLTGILANSNTYVPQVSVTDTFYVIQAANSCVSPSATVILAIHDLPVVTISGLNAQYFTVDPAVTLTGAPTGGTFSGPGINGNQFDPMQAGVGGPYQVTYTYTDPVTGCTNTTSTSVTVNLATGIVFTANGNSVNVYPNPANQQATLEVRLTEATEVTTELFDVTGKLLFIQRYGQQAAGLTTIVIDRGQLELSAGVYFLNVYTGEERVTIKLAFD